LPQWTLHGSPSLSRQLVKRNKEELAAALVEAAVPVRGSAGSGRRARAGSVSMTLATAVVYLPPSPFSAAQEFEWIHGPMELFSPATAKGHWWKYGLASQPLLRSPVLPADPAKARQRTVINQAYPHMASILAVGWDEPLIPLWKAEVLQPGIVLAGDYFSGQHAADAFVSGMADAEQVRCMFGGRPSDPSVDQFALEDRAHKYMWDNYWQAAEAMADQALPKL
jgi:hypothetical protein